MEQFIDQVNGAVSRQDGVKLAKLLSFTNDNVVSLAMGTNSASVDRDIRYRINDPNWAEVAVHHWNVLFQLALQRNLVEAYTLQNTMLGAINRVAEKSDNWMLPVMYMATRELRQLSILADKSESTDNVAARRAHTAKLEDATRTINRSLNICLNDRNQELDFSKKWGVYFFMGELFKIYFKLNNQPLAKNVIKVRNAMEPELPPLDGYPKSHRVTYQYYSGVLHFIDGRYEVAEKDLSSAMALCKATLSKNIEAILLFLIPIKMLRSSQVPSKTMWEMYPRLDSAYREIAVATKTGNVRAFDLALEQRRKLFVHRYLYLAIENIRSVCMYNLIHKTWVILGRATRLSVLDLSRAFASAGGWTDDDLYLEGESSHHDHKQLDEIHLNRVEGIVANFISSGQIKGYISHERRTVVLSNKEPFPAGDRSAS